MQAVRGLSRSFLSSKSTSTSLRSSPFSNKVFTHISNARANGSNLRCSGGRSFAALVPSDSSSSSSSSTPQRSPKRVSKDERRVMLIHFVDKYRASNSGKYPTPSAATKQVGGSYYVVKKILQEIQYNSQRSSVITSTINEAPFEKEVPQEESAPSQEATEISSSATGTDLTSSEQSIGLKDDSQTVPTTNLDIDEVSSSINQEKEETLGTIEMPVSIDAEKEVPQEECEPLPEATEISSSATGADLTSSEQSLGLKDDSQTVATTNLDMDEATSSTNRSKEETLGTVEMPVSEDALNSKTPVNASNTDEDNSPPMKATVWGNLKSFADGIINMWRKM